jgi:hypothetical protein
VDSADVTWGHNSVTARGPGSRSCRTGQKRPARDAARGDKNRRILKRFWAI